MGRGFKWESTFLHKRHSGSEDGLLTSNAHEVGTRIKPTRNHELHQLKLSWAWQPTITCGSCPHLVAKLCFLVETLQNGENMDIICSRLG